MVAPHAGHDGPRRYAHATVNRNLITRLGTAAGIVAAVIALVFVLVLQSVRDVDTANERARAAEQVVAETAGTVLREGSTALDAATRTQLTATLAGQRAQAEAQRSEANAATDRAVVISIIGLVVSAALLFALTSYLTRFIVVPLRRVNAAASAVAAGDLSVRVQEDGDAEPVELARSFNAMASGLQATQTELEGRNAELERQRFDLENALTDLAAEKHRIEVFHRAGERLAAAVELDTLGDVILRELADAIDADVGVLYATEPEDRAHLILSATRGITPELLPEELHEGDGLAGRALQERRIVTATRADTSLRVGAFGVETVVGTELHVPLKLRDRVLGVLSLGRLDDRPWNADDTETAGRLAEQASVALANVVSLRRALTAARVNRAVLDATPDPVGLLDLDGELVAENAPMAELWSAGEPVDAAAGDVDREVRDEVVFGERTYSRYAAPVRDSDNVHMGRLIVLRDVTAERESERLKDEFFALVSHELRTPLTSIIGYLELVRGEEGLPPDAARFLAVVDRNATRLLRLVGDMLFVAQVEAGRLSLERADVTLHDVVRDCAEAARPAAERGRIALETDIEPVPALIGDRDRLGQLVDNLVSNALKFTPEGGTVSLRLRDSPDAAIVEVADDGVGIPETEQDQLFDRFFRSSTAQTKAVPGAGLGLAIVKTIAEAHGGHVVLRSRPGAGTTVTVTLPYSPTSAGDPDARVTTPDETGPREPSR
jgi:signal transduction histidine kinase/HAMP domain-containing protein